MSGPWNDLREMPSTNVRCFIGVLLSIVFVVVSLGGIIAGRITAENQSTLYIVGGFIALEMGLDVAQFVAKRQTYQPDPPVAPQPAPPDREDAPKGETNVG